MKHHQVPFDGYDALLIALSLGALGLFAAIFTVQDVERFISGQAPDPRPRAAVATTVSEPVELGRLRYSGWGALLCARDCRDAVFFDGLLHIATAGGLLVYSPSGELIDNYTHLNGLPSNRLTCLACWQERLWIGTDSGLVAVRDGSAVVYSTGTPEANRISALLPYDDRLLVGTAGAGLLSFDGSSFSRDLAQLPGADFLHVNALALWRGQLAVASRDSGLSLLRGASFKRFGTAQGLPDEQVTSLAAAENGDLLVATIAGICALDESDSLTPWARPLMASAVLALPGSTLVATIDGRIELYSAGRRRSAYSLGDRRQPVRIRRLARADRRTYILADSGAFIHTPDGLEPFGQRPAAELSDGFIAALALDGAGNLWAGYFDAGLEVFDSSLRSVGRHDDEPSRTIKCLYFDPSDRAVYAGSSKGLLRFGADGQRGFWTSEDGLISNEVNCVCRQGGFIVAGTGGGVSFVSGTAVRSIYAFHGLVNNKVFAVLPVGEELVVGTLGGISLVSDMQVTGRITPENTDLPIHWITALAELDGAVLAGTYGHGLALRLPDGSWDELPSAVARDNLEINPNAILATDELVLAGTLDRGLAVYRRSEGSWQLTSRALPSANVTALAADERRFYIGTDNGIAIVDKSVL